MSVYKQKKTHKFSAKKNTMLRFWERTKRGEYAILIFVQVISAAQNIQAYPLNKWTGFNHSKNIHFFFTNYCVDLWYRICFGWVYFFHYLHIIWTEIIWSIIYRVYTRLLYHALYIHHFNLQNINWIIELGNNIITLNSLVHSTESRKKKNPHQESNANCFIYGNKICKCDEVLKKHTESNFKMTGSTC